ncbi:MAG: hypothetical protein ACHREM_11375 [Polyangiales bacterium]
MGDDERIYEAFELVRGNEVVILRSVTRAEAMSIAKLHTRSDKRTVHVRNIVTGEVVHVAISIAPIE